MVVVWEVTGGAVIFEGGGGVETGLVVDTGIGGCWLSWDEVELEVEELKKNEIGEVAEGGCYSSCCNYIGAWGLGVEGRDWGWVGLDAGRLKKKEMREVLEEVCW